MAGRAFVACVIAAIVCGLGMPGIGNGAGAETTTYFFGILSRGTNRSQPPAEAEQIQKGHLAHIGEMAASGKLVAAGPFGDDGAMRGILLFTTSSADEALSLESTDPAITSGRLVHEVRAWVGPASIGAKYAEMAKAGKADEIPMVTYQMVFLLKGPKWVDEHAGTASGVMSAHREYIRSLEAGRKVVAAGPFLDGGQFRGMAVYNVDSVDAAVALASEDPAVKAGQFSVDAHPWWCAKYVMPE